MSILIVQIFLEIDYQKRLSALLLLFDPTNRLQAIRISLYGRGAARADSTGTDTQRRSGCTDQTAGKYPKSRGCFSPPVQEKRLGVSQIAQYTGGHRRDRLGIGQKSLSSDEIGFDMHTRLTRDKISDRALQSDVVKQR